MAKQKPKNTANNGPMSNSMKKRLNVLVSFFLLLFLIYVVCNLFNLSVIKSDEMKEFAAGQQTRSLTINANRGTIYDRNREVLAQSSTVWNVVAAPSAIKGEDEEYFDKAAQRLSEALGMEYADVLECLQKSESSYEYLKKKVDKPTADAVRELAAEYDYGFITLQEDTKRYYPKDTLASQVIGLTNWENKGSYGVEEEYDEVLSGTNGSLLTATDANGNIIPSSYEKKYDAVDGNSIVLTLDSTIQHYAEKALEELVATHNPKGGACAIVMDVNTGAILAMANNPTFDLNNPNEIYSALYQEELNNPTEWSTETNSYVPLTLTEEEKATLENELILKQRSNKSISWLYQPGSVFKIVTASAALETGVQTMDSTYNCTGSINVDGQIYHCWKRSGQGVQNFTQMIVNSCNPAFIHMAQLMGIHAFCSYVDMFGITEPTGIDIFGESQTSIYYPEEQMTTVDLASEAFGQSLAITPIQMITAAAAVVNGGYLVQPYVVDSILDSDGNVVEKTETTVKRQVISEETSKNLCTTLEAMVKGSIVDLKGYRVGGKSGTSQIGNQSNGRYVGSFLGIAPIDDPQIAVLVVVDEPRGSEYYGSQVAGPALASILSDTLNYLGIAPEYSDTEVENLEQAVPNVLNKEVTAAQEELAQQGMEVQVVGSGTTVVDQMPQSGVSVAKGSKVILYTEAVSQPEMTTVPNVVGLTVAEANQVLTNAQLNISMDTSAGSNDGTVHVTTQSMPEGTSVPIGTVISITYAKEIADGMIE
ncbi:MAG: penicillin-binding transpeptidase domain-containing protein [Massiliimalia sp.]|jgi:stage V sporulation protein D (sporulation-specific penicillin-binding protein)